MRDLLIISGVLALFTIFCLIKAARHTWHIEILRHNSPHSPAAGRYQSPLPPAGGAGGGSVPKTPNQTKARTP